MNVSIRPMDSSDWERVSAIYQQGIATGNATFETTVPTYEEWHSSHMKECRLVAVMRDEIIGWAAITPVSGRCVYGGVAELSVYIDVNSRNMGVGCKLLNSIIEESEKLGFWMLQSGIFEENHESIALHKKCGFRYVGFRERIGRDENGRWRNTVLMERRSLKI